MKYDIIKTDNYLIIIGDTFIWEGNEPYFVAEKLVDGRYDVIQIDNVNDWATSTQYKILAHLPLNGNILENIPLLPQLEQEDDYLDGCEFEFVNGYNKAKEKYRFTEEDMLEFYNFYMECNENTIRDSLQVYIKSLLQPKYPIGFELELDVLETKDLGNGYSEFMKPLKKRWIGKYIWN